MSNADFQSGLTLGIARARSARQDADSAIADWSSFASNLEGKLLNESVERAVSVEYVKELRKALRELNPNHPLLKDEVATNLFESARVQAYQQRGFQYDPASGRFTRRAMR